MTLTALFARLRQRLLSRCLDRLTQLADVIERAIVAREHADRERHQRHLLWISLLVVDNNIAVAPILVVVLEADLGVEALAQLGTDRLEMLCRRGDHEI